MRPPVTYALLTLLIGLSLWNTHKDILLVLVIVASVLWLVDWLTSERKKKFDVYKIGISLVVGILLVINSKEDICHSNVNEINDMGNSVVWKQMPPRELELFIKIKEKISIKRDSEKEYDLYKGSILSVPRIRKDLLGKEVIWFLNRKEDVFINNDKVKCIGVISYLEVNDRKNKEKAIKDIYKINIRKIFIIEKSNIFLSDIRRKINLEFRKEEWYTKETGAFVYAILLGNKSLLNEKQLPLFMKTGTMHLFAVSGLHVGIIYLICSYILRRISEKRLIWIPLTLLIVYCYVALVNYSPSACRAFAMISLWQLGVLLNKKRNPLSSLYLTAVILLTIQPDYLLSIGFQLSFTVVLNIIFVMQGTSSKSDYTLVKVMKSTFAVSFSSFFGSLLLIIDNFHYINPLSIFINAILINAIFVVFIVLLFQIVLTLVFETHLLIFLVEIVYEIIEMVLNFFNGFSFFEIHFTKTLDIPNGYHLIYPLILIYITPYVDKNWKKFIVISVLPLSFVLIS
jgi:ComEC/Rec2-related protein